MPKAPASDGAGSGRACDACHRMKIRCVDRDTPPCQRCATMGSACTFTVDRSSPYRIKSNQDRVAVLERQMNSVQASVQRIEELLLPMVPDRERTGQQTHCSGSTLTLPDTVSSTNGFHSALATHHNEQRPPVFSNADAASEQQGFLLGGEWGMRDILHRDEEERLRREEQVNASNRASREVSPSGLNASDGTIVPLLARRGSVLQRFSDPVELGLCTETEGRRMTSLFFEGCHAFLPLFDRSEVTWESLRARSSFCVTAILVAAQTAAAAGDTEPSLHATARSGRMSRRALRTHAEQIAMATVFSPVASLEAVQAMVILANWGDTAWRPGNHALSLALDMDLHLCLPHLAKTGMGRNMTSEQVERERSLVAGARVWLAMCKTHTEMCMNYGRPTLVKFGDLGRAFLEHPLATPEDSRCVVLCETQVIKEPLYRAWRDPSQSNPPEQLIAHAMQQLDEWEAYWSAYYGRLGFAPDSFLVTELTTIKLYALLDINGASLHGIKSESDVQRLSYQRRQCLVVAVRAAASLVGRAVKSPEKEKIRYGNRNVRLGLAASARYLIRLASLVPDAIDLRQAAKDVERLADELSCFPDFHFSQFLRHVVVEARRRRELPPQSTYPSPRLSGIVPAESVESFPDVGLDFSIAEDIFSSETWSNIMRDNGQPEQNMVPGMSLPFFPLAMNDDAAGGAANSIFDFFSVEQEVPGSNSLNAFSEPFWQQ